MEGEERVSVSELSPESKRAYVLVKVVEKSEPKEIPSRFGPTRMVTEALVADDTGGILMSLWDDQAEQVSVGDVLQVDNGYISLVRGHMRLNIGKYGSMSQAEEELEANTETNMSDREFDMPRRNPRYGGRDGGSGGGYNRF